MASLERIMQRRDDDVGVGYVPHARVTTLSHASLTVFYVAIKLTSICKWCRWNAVDTSGSHLVIAGLGLLMVVWLLPSLAVPRLCSRRFLEWTTRVSGNHEFTFLA